MLINIYAARCIGIAAELVTVETDISAGIGIHLVGLADATVKESLLRTVTALSSLGFRVPGRKIVINLAPADIRKNGSGYDLPIALGIIAASQQAELPHLGEYIIMGELGLDGSIRDISGALPIAELAAASGFRGCILPQASAAEAADLENIRVYGVRSLTDVIRILSGEAGPEEYLITSLVRNVAEPAKPVQEYMDFADIVGQEAAKRGIEIAAAGGHNVAMIGPPGSGKSSLARAMAGILPPMTMAEALQTSKIYSVSQYGRHTTGLIRTRPFRAPHYSSSLPAIIGGGSDNILPGEVSLAHNGILFSDEFCEAPKKMIEALRAPLEDRTVTISRLKMKVEYPASFMLVIATNPCPCGYYGEGDKCTCPPGKRIAYLSKLSGPLMDRVDVQLWLHSVDPSKLVSGSRCEPTAEVAKRVKRARDIQEERFKDETIHTNAEMNGRMIKKYCQLDSSCKKYLEKVMNNLGLSARACTRIIKLARTIADLEGAETIRLEHLSEAAAYRFLDKQSPV